jgi:hypothetical protein
MADSAIRVSITMAGRFSLRPAIWAAKMRQKEFGRPGDYYIRWMKRFGVLPESFASTD